MEEKLLPRAIDILIVAGLFAVQAVVALGTLNPLLA